MSVGIGLKVAGVPDLKAMFVRARAAGADMAGLLDAVSGRLEERIGLRLDTKKDPDGRPWEPIAESTRLRYELADDGARRGTLLERTGLMRASLTRTVLKRDAVVGFGRPYAVFHEFGTARMPRRGLVFSDPVSGRMAEGDISAAEATAREWLEGEIAL